MTKINRLSKPAMSWALRHELEAISRDLGHQMQAAWPHRWVTREQMEAWQADKLAVWDAYRDARDRIDATLANALMIEADELPQHLTDSSGPTPGALRSFVVRIANAVPELADASVMIASANKLLGIDTSKAGKEIDA